MSRLVTGAALLLALFGVVTGNLYLPCNCHRAEGADAAARCCVARAPAKPSCCHGSTPAPDPAPKNPDRDGPDGCRICCMPRAPMDETPAAVSVSPPLGDAPAVACALPALGDEVVADVRRAPDASRRTIDPWLLSPEGLAVFLI